MILFRLCLPFIALLLISASEAKLRALYNSLDPKSVSQLLAFYELYPHSNEGQQAMQRAYFLLSQGTVQALNQRIPMALYPIEAIISLVNKPPETTSAALSPPELEAMEALANFLPNRRLKGYYATSEAEVLKLDTREIDLARGLLLSELGTNPHALAQIRTYEAALDLMALQILCNTSLEASPKNKIRAINRFIFGEMGFRFPAHSTYAKEIDLYTFLPSVLDSRKGVCLGVSLLYMCLAQRLNLDLEMVTPPGHIYVRYRKGNDIINIETTARGIHVDCEEYLGIDTRSLQTRSIKDVIGMAHFNQASVFWEQEKYPQAIASYQHALLYVPEDPFVKELLAYNYLLDGQEEKGKELLRQIKDILPDHAVSKDITANDFLNGNTDVKGLHAIFMRVDESRDSILAKKEAIEESLKKYPDFQAGLFSLAITWLQLQRDGEALEVLKKYHALNASDATVEYYLAALYGERFDYSNAWKHLKMAEKLVEARNHNPRCLKELRQELTLVSPLPLP